MEPDLACSWWLPQNKEGDEFVKTVSTILASTCVPVLVGLFVLHMVHVMERVRSNRRVAEEKAREKREDRVGRRRITTATVYQDLLLKEQSDGLLDDIKFIDE